MLIYIRYDSEAKADEKVVLVEVGLKNFEIPVMIPIIDRKVNLGVKFDLGSLGKTFEVSRKGIKFGTSYGIGAEFRFVFK